MELDTKIRQKNERAKKRQDSVERQQQQQPEFGNRGQIHKHKERRRENVPGWSEGPRGGLGMKSDG